MLSSKALKNLADTLAFRLTLWFALSFAGVMIAAHLVLYLSVDSVFYINIKADLEQEVIEFQEIFEQEGMVGVVQEIERESSPADSQIEFLRLLDLDGNLLFYSDLTHWEGLTLNYEALREAAREGAPPVISLEHFAGHDHETVVAYGMISPGLIINIGESTKEKNDIMSLLLKAVAIMLSVVFPLTAAVGWVVVRRALRGVEEVSRAAVDIEKGELDRRVTIHVQGREIKNLVHTFNAMADRIRRLILEMREMIDNIAHDLRSPITRIRAISETALTGAESIESCHKAAADTLVECEHLINLINTTLDVAEAEAGVGNETREHIDLSSLAEVACELFEPAAEQGGVTLACNITANCILTGNRQNLQRMFTNLLDNAIKYTPRGGWVRVTLTYDEHEARVSFADSGIGIPYSEQSRVFQRFYRCDQSRAKQGCGLGLSFALAVAHAHGGDITLRDGNHGGSIFTITLPLKPS